jgi:nitrogen fixation protein NifB
MHMDMDTHPCFSRHARSRYARVHLPVAPQCNMQCGYCDRSFDCVNESRPGVTSRVLSPEEAVAYYAKLKERIPDIAVVGIAGPGDPLANPLETLMTLKGVREIDPSVTLCLATNGLKLATFAEALADYGVSHVTVTVNAVDPKIGEHIYQWMRCDKRVYRGREAAELLLSRQVQGIEEAKRRGLTVKINTVVISGINDRHVEEVAARMAWLGVDIQNCIPLYHVEGTAFAGFPIPDAATMEAIRLGAGKHLKQMSHCARCRADAAGLIGEDRTETVQELLGGAADAADRPYAAVTSLEGIYVNQHLGESAAVWIYRLENERAVLVERRPLPEPGAGDERWREVSRILSDCRTLLTAGIGESPTRVLERGGLRIVVMDGMAAPVVEALLAGVEPPAWLVIKARGVCGRGVACGGTGTGCG